MFTRRFDEQQRPLMLDHGFVAYGPREDCNCRACREYRARSFIDDTKVDEIRALIVNHIEDEVARTNASGGEFYVADVRRILERQGESIRRMNGIVD